MFVAYSNEAQATPNKKANHVDDKIARHVRLRGVAQDAAANAQFNHPVQMLASWRPPESPIKRLENMPCKRHLAARTAYGCALRGMPILYNHRATDENVVGVVDDYVINNDGTLYLIGRVDKSIWDLHFDVIKPLFCSIGYASSLDCSRVAWLEVSVVDPHADPKIPYTNILMSTAESKLFTRDQLRSIHFRQFEKRAKGSKFFINAMTTSSNEVERRLPFDGDVVDYRTYKPPQDTSGFFRTAQTLPVAIQRHDPSLATKSADAFATMIKVMQETEDEKKQLRRKTEEGRRIVDSTHANALDSSAAPPSQGPNVADPEIVRHFANSMFYGVGARDATDEDTEEVSAAMQSFFAPGKSKWDQYKEMSKVVGVVSRVIDRGNTPSAKRTTNAASADDQPTKTSKRATGPSVAEALGMTTSMYNIQNETARNRHAQRLHQDSARAEDPPVDNVATNAVDSERAPAQSSGPSLLSDVFSQLQEAGVVEGL